MKRVRSNRGGLYPTGKPKRVGFKDVYFDYTCSDCGEVILKKESQMSIPDKCGTKRFHWDCKPEIKNV